MIRVEKIGDVTTITIDPAKHTADDLCEAAPDIFRRIQVREQEDKIKDPGDKKMRRNRLFLILPFTFMLGARGCTPCKTNDDCPSNETCVEAKDGKKYCFAPDCKYVSDACTDSGGDCKDIADVCK